MSVFYTYRERSIPVNTISDIAANARTIINSRLRPGQGFQMCVTALRCAESKNGAKHLYTIEESNEILEEVLMDTTFFWR